MERLGLSTFKSEMIKKLNITKIQDFYEISPLTVFAETQLNISDLNEITEIVSKKVAPKPKTALELLIEKSHDLRVLSTGCQDFDEILGGGIYYDGITELVGSPGVGKTQFCFSCCVEAVIQNRGVIFIDTELKFDPLRLFNLIETRIKDMNNFENTNIPQSKIESALDSIQLKRPTSCRELMNEIENLEDAVISGNVALIVLDSIAALARKESLQEADKEEYLVRQSAILKRLAQLCNCCILVTNQIINVTESVNAQIFNDLIVDASGDLYRPALGPIWYHCVSTRLVFHKRKKKDIGNEEEISVTNKIDSFQSFERVLTVSKSPSVENAEAVFEIQAQGIIAKKI